ncbi:hypothetical protein [Streptomyces sp. PT12]|uniref:hypothetical protein n=1 Tax=Streptomyces sp. PT12 TaxID=1510197 RepID=UPI001C66A690|nr:hypothetical protein [Streptomyces sp. PT12]
MYALHVRRLLLRKCYGIDKQYQAGCYGLSTAGNVVLFLLVSAVVVPLFRFLNRREAEL